MSCGEEDKMSTGHREEKCTDVEEPPKLTEVVEVVLGAGVAVDGDTVEVEGALGNKWGDISPLVVDVHCSRMEM